MEEFRSKIVQVEAGEAVMLEPVDFDNRVSEARLETWLVANPELAGEPLLILGSQLAEFAEDKDRLDVLAIDKQGEIVLLELKVDGQFRLTDLQALAYAAGYSGMPIDHFAEILRKALERDSDPDATVEYAKEQIVEFVDVLDEFDEWQPSKRVRIKLVAPGYPKRVLHTVKWLGDVYGMPIEAIQVQLFEDAAGRYQLTFERLLPLKSDDAFDLTVKVAEERIAGISKPKKPAILKALLENEIIQPGQKLWLHPTAFAAADKHLFDPENVVFQVSLEVRDGKPMFRWRRAPDAPEKVLSPSRAWFPIFQEVLPGKYMNEVASPVFNHFSLEPGGPTLGEIAEQHGIW
jgi:hypothetical protein